MSRLTYLICIEFKGVIKMTKGDLSKVYSIRRNVLFKTAKESIHFLKKPAGIAIDLEIFNIAKGKVKYVQVYGKEQGIYYTALITDFIKHGFVINRGYGDQIVLVMKYWEKSHIPDIIEENFKKLNESCNIPSPIHSETNKNKQLSLLL